MNLVVSLNIVKGTQDGETLQEMEIQKMSDKTLSDKTDEILAR